MRPKYSKILFIIMAVVLLGDLVFSYLQYNCSTIDGDMPFIVLGQDGYDKVLNDPLGLSTFQGETYPGTNRYASHKLMEVYFKTVPFFFQNFMSPIDSVYLSITLAKFVAHILLLLVLGYYVSVWFTWAKWKSYLTSSVIISSFLIGGNMYIDHLAIIDPAVTYIMFYALPMTALLAFYIPFYKYYITGAFPTSPLFAALWVVFALVMVFFGALTCAMLLVTLPMFAAGIMWRAYSNLPQDSKSLVRAVILTRQFRLPTYVNGNETGMMIEACAGLLDKDNPEDCIRKETEEETGYKITEVQKVFEAYMSPGSVTEILYFFIAEYAKEMKVSSGGGLAHEQENIEVLELSITDAMNMIATGEIKDGKTIMLLQHIKLSGIM